MGCGVGNRHHASDAGNRRAVATHPRSVESVDRIAASPGLRPGRPSKHSRLAPRKGRHQVKEPCVRFDSGSQKRGATPYAAGVRPFT